MGGSSELFKWIWISSHVEMHCNAKLPHGLLSFLLLLLYLLLWWCIEDMSFFHAQLFPYHLSLDIDIYVYLWETVYNRRMQTFFLWHVIILTLRNKHCAALIYIYARKKMKVLSIYMYVHLRYWRTILYCLWNGNIKQCQLLMQKHSSTRNALN